MEIANLLQGIDTVIIRVTDLRASRNWYTGKLGLAVAWEDGNAKLLVLDTNGPTSLTLWETGATFSHNGETTSYPIFRTPDAQALRTLLLSRDVDAGELKKDEGVTYFSFRDPDGNILEACQVAG